MNQPGRLTRKDRRIAQRQRASRNQQRGSRSAKAASRRWWYLSGALVLVAVAVWVLIQNDFTGGSESGGIPGPIGGDLIAQDINTMVGQPAPAFTLANAEGETFEVTPGSGRPIVLVFQMGIT